MAAGIQASGTKLIERYIFRRMLSAMVLSFIALSAMFWLSQALRQFNLVTDQGQALSTFLQLSAYLLPILDHDRPALVGAGRRDVRTDQPQLRFLNSP